MYSLEIPIGIRNILLVHLLLLVLMVPAHMVLVRQELHRLWRTINAPFLRKEAAKKGSRFWEIDMTNFEP